MFHAAALRQLEQGRRAACDTLAALGPRVVIARGQVDGDFDVIAGAKIGRLHIGRNRNDLEIGQVQQPIDDSRPEIALGTRHQHLRHVRDDNRCGARSIFDMAEGDPADDPSENNPFSNNPLSGIPMFGDLARALSGQGPLNWEAARQFAQLAATEGASESNVDPALRFALADLARIAEPHVLDVTGQDVAGFEVSTTTPGAWSQQALDAYRPLFTELAVSLGKRPITDDDGEDDSSDPMMAMMAGLSQMMAPSMLGMAIGSMIGRLGKRAFGQYDLPIPRPAAKSVALVPATIDAFAADWSLPRDSMRLWVLVHELTTHAVFSVAHIREGLSDLVRSHVGAFQPDPSAVAEKLSTLDMDTDDPMQALQRTLGDPEILLARCGARPRPRCSRSSTQRWPPSSGTSTTWSIR